MEQSGQTSRIAMAALWMSTSIISTTMRIYTRAGIIKELGWDDVWMVATVIFNIILSTCQLLEAHYSGGKHESEISATNLVLATKFWWLAYFLYAIDILCLKLSIGFLLLRISPRYVDRVIIHITLYLSALCSAAFFLTGLLSCRPVSFLWNRNQSGSCISVVATMAVSYTISGIAMATDLIFAILPIFLVWSLNLPGRTKFMLVPIFAMAALTAVAVAIRIPSVKSLRSPDFLYETHDLVIWSEIELGLGILVANLATMRPLLNILMRKCRLSSSSSEQPERRTARSLRWTRGVVADGTLRSTSYNISSNRASTSQKQCLDSSSLEDLPPAHLQSSTTEDHESVMEIHSI